MYSNYVVVALNADRAALLCVGSLREQCLLTDSCPTNVPRYSFVFLHSRYACPLPCFPSSEKIDILNNEALFRAQFRRQGLKCIEEGSQVV
jgi:hypothetical protein